MDDDLSALVLRSQRRDVTAFARLIRRFERTALSIAYAQLGDAGRAADAVQEGFLKAWQRIGDLNEPTRFPAWLCGIVRNAAIDLRRRNKPADPSPERPRAKCAPLDDPANRLEDSERREQIHSALDELDELSRSAVVLRYYENFSSRQIGELLGISASAVDMRLSRARQELRQHLAALMPEQAARM